MPLFDIFAGSFDSMNFAYMFNRLKTVDAVCFLVGFIGVLFFSSYRLYESPPTWMDEGLIIQAAQGLAQTGKAALPVAPGEFEAAGYITTGFPLTLPLAGAFAFFGESLYVARLVMFVFLILFFITLWFFTRRGIHGLAGLTGFLLIVFFGPVYGHGRNVLGEIPGLLCLLIALLPLLRDGVLSRRAALFAGLGAGLAVAAKPIFILFIPALLLALFLRQRELGLKRVFMVGLLGAAAPFLLWLALQFDHITLSRVLAIYANPHDINIINAIFVNFKRFFTELQPLYFLGSLFLWILSYVVRRVRHEKISLPEETLLFFSVLILLAYMRTVGYYRYFFPGQVFAVLYLPQTLWYLFSRGKRFYRVAVMVFVCLLIVGHIYETSFRSWVAVHYDVTRTAALTRYFAELPKEETVFIYQAPELMPFAAGRPLYQYVEITPSIHPGERFVPLVSSGSAPHVMTSEEFFTSHAESVFAHYTTEERVEDYVMLVSERH
jgi:4-amino-4-deoxy-L-arabinose transferase-like glycosyltransferase